jgi:ribosomal protein S18 acetylase RimI-like enzyme
VRSEIRRLDPLDEQARRDVAGLHAHLLPTSPIVRIGRRFARDFYYRSLVADGLVGCHVAYVDGVAAGFLAFTADPAHFMSIGLRRHWPRIARTLLVDVVTDPRRAAVILWTLGYMRSRKSAVPPGEAELLSLGVMPQFRSIDFVRSTGLRISTELFGRARADLLARGVQRFHGVVEAKNREALMFYQALGCRVDPERQSAPGTVVIVGDFSQ